ncbi:hypothetical protein [Actinoplanes sp. NPDC051851]|uniref:hypothetical protein n=1 Tax=Actinoplanes sp. NPDC051851 TaxID=3154753 RepID=UPI003432EAF0
MPALGPIVRTWWIPTLGLVLLLVAVGGLWAVDGGAESIHAAPPSRPGDGTDPGLADRALAAVSTDAATATVLRRGLVRTGYLRSEPDYLGLLTLRAACAGNGRFTLRVRGLPGGVALAEVPVPCGAQPEPVGATFLTGGDITLVEYAIEEVDRATVGSGFAYRVTSSTGDPIIRGDATGDPTAALELSGHAGFGGSDSATDGDGGVFAKRLRLRGRYRLAAACTGSGTLHLEVRGTGHAVDVRCQWPPARQDVDLGTIVRDVDLTYSYTADSIEPTDFAFQMISR